MAIKFIINCLLYILLQYVYTSCPTPSYHEHVKLDVFLKWLRLGFMPIITGEVTQPILNKSRILQLP